MDSDITFQISQKIKTEDDLSHPCIDNELGDVSSLSSYEKKMEDPFSVTPDISESKDQLQIKSEVSEPDNVSSFVSGDNEAEDPLSLPGENNETKDPLSFTAANTVTRSCIPVTPVSNENCEWVTVSAASKDSSLHLPSFVEVKTEPKIIYESGDGVIKCSRSLNASHSMCDCHIGSRVNILGIVKTDRKPFKCGVCEETFKCHSTLERHERIHNGIKKVKERMKRNEKMGIKKMIKCEDKMGAKKILKNTK